MLEIKFILRYEKVENEVRKTIDRWYSTFVRLLGLFANEQLSQCVKLRI